MQGEWDALNSVDAGNYESNLTFFVQAIRDAFSEPDLPFILGRLNKDIYKSSYGISQTDLEKVRTAQVTVADTLASTAWVDTDGLPLNSDFIHFSADGQLGLGFGFAVADLALSQTTPLNLVDVDTLDLYPGDKVFHSVTGPPGAAYMTFLSLGGGPTPTPWGVMGLQLPVYLLWANLLNGDGFHTVPIVMVDTGSGFISFFTHTLVDASPPVWAHGGNNPNGSGSIQWGLH
jgi:hypothetical protein